MKLQDTQEMQGRSATPREGLRELLARPAVRMVLLATAAAQLAAVQGGGEGAETGVVARLDPMVASAPAPVVAVAESDRALEEAGEDLAAAYRARGFKVSDHLAQEIHEAAVKNDIDPEVAFGLVHAESGFRNVATSRVGAVGLTQLMPATARWLEPGVTRTELRDPETNLRIGFMYLRQLIDKYDGDVDLALTAYNRGPGTVDRALKRGRNPDNGYAAFVKTGKRGRHKG